MLIQRVYIKVQTTGYTQKQESQIRLCQKTCKKKKKVGQVCKWNLWIFGNYDELLPEWWKTKSAGKERRGSWSEAHHALCQTWWSQCYGMGMFGCQLNHWCLLMMWLVIEVAGWITKCTGLYSLLSFRQNAAALTGQMVNDAKHTAKATPLRYSVMLTQ